MGGSNLDWVVKQLALLGLYLVAMGVVLVVFVVVLVVLFGFVSALAETV